MHAHWSVHGGRNWPALPAELKAQLPQPTRASQTPESGSPGGPARPARRFPPSALLARKPRMPPRAATSRGCARPHLIPRKRASGPGDPRCSALATPSPMPPPHTAWPPQVSRRPRSSKDHARGGAVPSGHATRHHPTGEPSAHSLPQAGLPVRHRNAALFLEKPPPPTFPPKHSPASRRSSPRATRGRTRARPGLSTLPGATGPARLPPPPTSLCPQEGRCHLPKRPIPSTPAARSRALGTSRAQPPPPPPAFPPEAGLGLPPSGGRTPLGAAAPRTALSLGVQNRPEARRRVPALPAPTPTPPPPAPALACYDSELQLLRLAPPAVSTAAEESLRAGSAERRWRRRRPQSWRRREGRLEPGETPALPASRRRPASSPGRQLPQ